MLLLSAVLVAALIPSSAARAQESPTMKMGWTQLAPLIYRDDAGEVAGIFADTHRLLAQEIGFEPVFIEYETTREMVDALRSGETDVFPGIAKLPALRDTVVFSDEIASREARLMARNDVILTVNPTNLAGLRIGTVPPSVGSSPDLLPGADIRAFDEPSDAIFALLMGQIDAVSMPTFLSFPTARAARVDDQLTFVGGPLAQYSHYVALHQRHAGMLDQVNTAIAEMRADGRLAGLEEKYFLSTPRSAPPVLTVGVVHSPPYQVIEGGRFSGFAVEVLRELADRANLQLRFIEISLDNFDAGPGPGRYDVLAIEAVSDSRARRMDFTLPIDQGTLSIFLSKDAGGDAEDLQSLDGRRVGMLEGIAWERTALNNPHFETVYLPSGKMLLDALLTDAVDAVIDRTSKFSAIALAEGHADDIRTIEPPITAGGQAIAFRPGLGELRGELDAVIPGFLISNAYQQLRSKWLEEPVFWTPVMLNVLAAFGAVLLGALVGFIIWDQAQRRQRLQAFQMQEIQLELETRHSRELAELVGELERSNSDLNDFAYVASHDLKEPLRGIAINADFLMREEVSPAVSHRVDRMVELTARMQQLISDLLFFSRLGRDERDRRKVDLKSVLQGLRLDLRETLEERGGRIRVVTELPTLQLDLSRVKTVFQNLIMNALTYNDSAEKIIEIGFEKEINVDGKVMKNAFFVRDNGIGIDERNHDKVFRIFTRLNRESEYGRGTGAGLSFVKKVVEGYGGDITFQSFNGEGTTFYLSLPLADEFLEAETSTASTTQHTDDNTERALL